MDAQTKCLNGRPKRSVRIKASSVGVEGRMRNRGIVVKVKKEKTAFFAQFSNDFVGRNTDSNPACSVLALIDGQTQRHPVHLKDRHVESLPLSSGSILEVPPVGTSTLPLLITSCTENW
jgi:hypothetical protein